MYEIPRLRGSLTHLRTMGDVSSACMYMSSHLLLATTRLGSPAYLVGFCTMYLYCAIYFLLRLLYEQRFLCYCFELETTGSAINCRAGPLGIIDIQSVF